MFFSSSLSIFSLKLQFFLWNFTIFLLVVNIFFVLYVIPLFLFALSMFSLKLHSFSLTLSWPCAPLHIIPVSPDLHLAIPQSSKARLKFYFNIILLSSVHSVVFTAQHSLSTTWGYPVSCYQHSDTGGASLLLLDSGQHHGAQGDQLGWWAWVGRLVGLYFLYLSYSRCASWWQGSLYCRQKAQPRLVNWWGEKRKLLMNVSLNLNVWRDVGSSRGTTARCRRRSSARLSTRSSAVWWRRR